MYLAEKVYKRALLGMHHTSAKKETTSEGDGWRDDFDRDLFSFQIKE